MSQLQAQPLKIQPEQYFASEDGLTPLVLTATVPTEISTALEGQSVNRNPGDQDEGACLSSPQHQEVYSQIMVYQAVIIPQTNILWSIEECPIPEIAVAQQYQQMLKREIINKTSSSGKERPSSSSAEMPTSTSFRNGALFLRDSETLKKIWAWRPTNANPSLGDSVIVPTALLYVRETCCVWIAWSDGALRSFDILTRKIVASIPNAAKPAKAITCMILSESVQLNSKMMKKKKAANEEGEEGESGDPLLLAAKNIREDEYSDVAVMGGGASSYPVVLCGTDNGLVLEFDVYSHVQTGIANCGVAQSRRIPQPQDSTSGGRSGYGDRIVFLRSFLQFVLVVSRDRSYVILDRCQGWKIVRSEGPMSVSPATESLSDIADFVTTQVIAEVHSQILGPRNRGKGVYGVVRPASTMSISNTGGYYGPTMSQGGNVTFETTSHGQPVMVPTHQHPSAVVEGGIESGQYQQQMVTSSTTTAPSSSSAVVRHHYANNVQQSAEASSSLLVKGGRGGSRTSSGMSPSKNSSTAMEKPTMMMMGKSSLKTPAASSSSTLSAVQTQQHSQSQLSTATSSRPIPTNSRNNNDVHRSPTHGVVTDRLSPQRNTIAHHYRYMPTKSGGNQKISNLVVASNTTVSGSQPQQPRGVSFSPQPFAPQSIHPATHGIDPSSTASSGLMLQQHLVQRPRYIDPSQVFVVHRSLSQPAPRLKDKANPTLGGSKEEASFSSQQFIRNTVKLLGNWHYKQILTKYFQRWKKKVDFFFPFAIELQPREEDAATILLPSSWFEEGEISSFRKLSEERETTDQKGGSPPLQEFSTELISNAKNLFATCRRVGVRIWLVLPVRNQVFVNSVIRKLDHETRVVRNAIIRPSSTASLTSMSLSRIENNESSSLPFSHSYHVRNILFPKLSKTRAGGDQTDEEDGDGGRNNSIKRKPSMSVLSSVLAIESNVEDFIGYRYPPSVVKVFLPPMVESIQTLALLLHEIGEREDGEERESQITKKKRKRIPWIHELSLRTSQQQQQQGKETNSSKAAKCDSCKGAKCDHRISSKRTRINKDVKVQYTTVTECTDADLFVKLPTLRMYL